MFYSWIFRLQFKLKTMDTDSDPLPSRQQFF